MEASECEECTVLMTYNTLKANIDVKCMELNLCYQFTIYDIYFLTTMTSASFIFGTFLGTGDKFC
jgi:hypothetical protein